MSGSLSSTPIIVLGSFRSGTSLVAQLVERWGAYGGEPEHMRPGDSKNPHGYFENQRMQYFIEVQLIRNVQEHVHSPEYPERVRERASDPEVRGEALELLESMGRRGNAWYWKEPLLSLTLPFWKELWGDPVYVVPVRNPYDTAVSWQRFVVPDAVQGRVSIIAANLLQWQFYNRSMLIGTADSARKIFVPYEALRRTPLEQCRRLSEFLDRECGTDGLREDRVEWMADAIDPDLHRNRSEPSLDDVWQATPEQRELYDLLLRKVDDPDAPFDEARYRLYAGWSEYLRNIWTFGAYYQRTSAILESPIARFQLGVYERARALWRRVR